MDRLRDRVMTSEAPTWRHPDDDPQPHSVKLLILSPYGIAQTGDWYQTAAAWMPMPKIGEALKARLRAEGRLR